MSNEQRISRRELLRFMERFGRWARKLDDTDLTAVVLFCTNVQAAWTEGQAKVEDAAEAVAKGLPGISVPIDVADLTSDPAGPTAPITEEDRRFGQPHYGHETPELTPPNICTDCGADLGETGHFVSCLSQAAHRS